MSKRNLTILIICLTIVSVVFFVFLYNRFREEPTPGEEDNGNFFSKFNPFDSNKTPSTPPTSNPASPSSNNNGVDIPKIKLRRISSVPVAGFGVFQKERYVEMFETERTENPTPPTIEFAPNIRYVDRITGNIYQTFADKIEERKFSDTLVPKVHEAYFGNKGESVIMRYLKADDHTIETFVGTLPKELLGGDSSEINTVTGTFLPENISDISISADTSKIFYLLQSGESVIGITADASGNKKTQVFDSPFTEWLPLWPNTNIIALTTKPSGVAPGYLYFLDPVKKSLSNIFGNINGLTTLVSPDRKLVLFAGADMNLGVYNLETKESILLGVRTLPEKCVWAKGNDKVYCGVPKTVSAGIYPDSWYQGEASFSDEIWQIEIPEGVGSMLLDPTLVGEGEQDTIKPALDEAEKYLFFVNKKDSFLWELDLQ